MQGPRSGSQEVHLAGSEDASERASGELLLGWTSTAIAFQLPRSEAYRGDQVIMRILGETSSANLNGIQYWQAGLEKLGGYSLKCD